MNFLENIFARLADAAQQPILQKSSGDKIASATGGELLNSIATARKFIQRRGLKKGDRCGLLGHNSIHWAAIDLALMAEGVVVVPLYARQEAPELVRIVQDCSTTAVFCGNEELRNALARNGAAAQSLVLFDHVFAPTSDGNAAPQPMPLADADPVRIIYTSGTSGEPKGVVLNVGNISYMLGCTSARLDLLMGSKPQPAQVLHYLPFNFAGSWIMLLTSLWRASLLTITTDLARLGDDIIKTAPDYFLNVPALLERVRKSVVDQLRKNGGIAEKLFVRSQAAWFQRQANRAAAGDRLWLGIARATLFPVIRKKIAGRNLRALICGSAPLQVETQLFFQMLGMPVLQVYGLTETTAICTMDDPRHVVPGRVGPAIPGVEMKLGAQDEILVRGPNIFPGYWKRPEETSKVLREGWFHTGDQGAVDESGNWRIVGRLKNLIILASGHNVAPEPIEEALLKLLPTAQQVVLFGNGRGFLSAVLTGTVRRQEVEPVLESLNSQLPHYKRIHAFHIHEEPFTVENGLLTANGKLRRELIAVRLQHEIDALYAEKQLVS